MAKRENYISWDEYFMGIALLSAKRSKDPSTQVGACIVSDDNKIMSVGYNGFPRGCSDDEYPWERSGESSNDTKYPFVCHAELNAIRKASKKLGDWRLEGCTMYVTLEPCQMCSGAIIQARIPRVVMGCRNPKAGCAGSILNLLKIPEFNHQAEITEGILEEECSMMLKNFFKDLRKRLKMEKKERMQASDDASDGTSDGAV